MDKATGQNTPANRPNVRVVICCCCPFELAASFLLKLRVSAQIGLLLESEWVMRGERSSSAVESILWSCDNSPLIEHEWDITLWPWLYQITPCLLHLLWSQISWFFFGFTWRGNHMIRPKRRVGCANSYFPPEKIAYPKSRNWLLILVWFTCSWWEYRISKKRQRVMISFYSNSLYCYMYLITDRVCMTMTPPPFVSESRNNMVPKATHMFTHW